MKNDREYMQVALALAEHCGGFGEVPVGAVVVWEDGRIVGCGYNTRESDKTALGHAELMAISSACKNLGGWRLHKATLYVTLEPCAMCSGAILNSRIKRVVFGAYDEKAGSMGSVVNLCKLPYNHKPIIVGGFMGEESIALLKVFFSGLRERKRKKQEDVNS